MQRPLSVRSSPPSSFKKRLQRMDSSSARDSFNRLRSKLGDEASTLKESGVDTFSTLQDKFSANLQNLPQNIQTLSERIPANLGKNLESIQTLSEKTSRPRAFSTPRPLSSSSSPSSRPSRPSSPLQKAPAMTDPSYDPQLASLASKILYRSGNDPISGGPMLVLSAACFPDARMVDYNKLLPYVLSVLPANDELAEGSSGAGSYSVVFFAGGGGSGKGDVGKGNKPPSWGWTLQAYHLLGRAVKKNIRKLWVVHERAWVRILFEAMAGVVSVKFRKKVHHVNTLSELSAYIDITTINIPPAVYLHDRKLTPQITLSGFPPAPIFGRPPFHSLSNPPRIGDNTPLPQVLVDTARYIRSSCLSVEGIFRIPPSSALMDIVREAYDRNQFLKWEDYGPHVAAGLVKLFYRSLPEPLIPSSKYADMMALCTAESEQVDEEKAFWQVKVLFERDEPEGLPRTSKVLLLRHLLPLLALVAQNAAINKMSPVNLGVCVAASLVRSDNMIADAKASRGVQRFLEIGIERIEELAPKLPLRRHGAERREGRQSMDEGRGSPPPPYATGTRHMPPRKKVPFLTAARDQEKPMPARKPVPQSRPVSPANPIAQQNDSRRGSLPSIDGSTLVGEERRGSVPSIGTIPAPSADDPCGSSVLRRKASFQSLRSSAGFLDELSKSRAFLTPTSETKGPLVTGSLVRERQISFSSMILPTSAVKPPAQIEPPRVIRRSISSTFPSSNLSLANPYPAIMKSKTPPPPNTKSEVAYKVPTRAKSDLGIRRVGGSAVEELRALYEERAKGVEVLVRSGIMKDQK